MLLITSVSSESSITITSSQSKLPMMTTLSPKFPEPQHGHQRVVRNCIYTYDDLVYRRGEMTAHKIL